MKNKILLQLKSVVLLPMLFLLFMAMSTIGRAQTVTVTTDQDDYYPGQWVIITGSGWQNDVDVQLTLTHLDPLPDPLHTHDSWLVQPNDGGYIYYEWFVEEQELNTSFQLDALGLSTGLNASTFFTDGSHTGFSSALIIGVPVAPICSGTTVQLSLDVTNCHNTSGSGNTTYTANYLWQQSSDNSTWTNADGINNNNTYSTNPDANTYYYCIITITGNGQYCGLPNGTVYPTSSVSISVNTSPNVYNVSYNPASICNPPFIMTLSGSEVGVNYQALRNNDNQVEQTIAGTGNPLQFDGLTQTMTYYVKAINATTGCSINMNGTATVTNANAPTAFNVTGGGSVCLNTAASYSVGISGSETSVNYQVYYNDGVNAPVAVGTSVTGTGAAITSLYSASLAGTYTVIGTRNTGNNCLTQMNGVATISVDVTPPSFVGTLPANATVECDAVPTPATLTATDNLDIDVEVTFQETTEAGDCPNNYTLTRIWTAKDDCENSTTHTQVITVQDTKAPVWVEIMEELDADLACADADGLETALAAAPTATDACGSGVTIELASDNRTGGDCLGSYVRVRTWTATDDCGNTSEVYTQTITVTDKVAPVWDQAAEALDADLACADAEGLETALAAAPTATDACGSGVTIKQASDNRTDGDCLGSYVRVRTWTATDDCGNTSEVYTQTITVTDEVAPVFTSAICGTTNERATDDGDCIYTVNGNEFDATAEDECNSGVTLTWKLTGATTDEGTSTTLASKQFNFGITIITWTATDGCGNASTCELTVNVNEVSTVTTVTVTPTSQQYSDKVTFASTVTTCEGAGTIEGTVTFKVGTQTMGTVNVQADGTATLANVPLLEPNPFGTAPTGQMALGGKTVTATYSGAGAYLSSTGTTDLTITCEDAVVTNNGGSYFTANPNSGDGSVALSAYVVDSPDGNPGDIRNATVTFHDGSISGGPLGNANIAVGLISAIPTEGFATTDLNYTLKSADISAGGKIWEVWTTVNNYYCGQTSDFTPVTLAMPGPDYVTGGGHIIMTNTSGLYPGVNNVGKRMNFGLVMKWNKSGKNLQGNINIIYRGTGGNNYQIKSNAINSLAIASVDNTGKTVATGATFKMATITTKANLKQLTSTGSVDLGGNATLIVTAWESLTDKTGHSDRISVQLAAPSGSGIWFSSNWNGGKSVFQQLNGGKIQVQSGITPPLKSAEITTAVGEIATEPTLKVYPNPFTERLNIEFSSVNDTRAKLEIFNIAGSKLETLFDAPVNGGQLYKVEYLPKLVSSQIVLYHLTRNGKTQVGKMIYQERR